MNEWIDGEEAAGKPGKSPIPWHIEYPSARRAFFSSLLQLLPEKRAKAYQTTRSAPIGDDYAVCAQGSLRCVAFSYCTRDNGIPNLGGLAPQGSSPAGHTRPGEIVPCSDEY